ncbi:MAG: DCC1-like thiol-disulfide oxidoreductase family protein [Pseudomonadota bacterium]
MPQPTEIAIVYDGECPFCASYVGMVRLRQAAGSVRLIDARGGGPEVDRIRKAGLDLDEGMVLLTGDEMYHGADCIHRMGLMSTRLGVFNRLNAWVFRSPARSRFLYPILRAGRNLALKILRRKKISGEAF